MSTNLMPISLTKGRRYTNPQTDVFTITIDAKNDSDDYTLTLPRRNAVGYLSNDGNGNLINTTELTITSISDGVATLTGGALSGVTTIGCSGVITSSNATGSTSKDTGAFVTEGGIGIEENIYAGGNIVATGNVQGASVLSGGRNVLTNIQQNITVGKAGAQYTSIQSAIDSITDASTSKRYTIQISPGEYTENITGKTFVSLNGIGTDPHLVIIKGTTSLYTSSATYCEISNLSFQIEPTTTSQKVITISSGTHLFDNCHFNLYTSTDDVEGELIRQTGGTIIITRCDFIYSQTANTTSTLTHNIIYLSSGIPELYISRSSMIVELTSEVDDTVNGIHQHSSCTSGSTIFIQHFDTTITLNGSYTGNTNLYTLNGAQANTCAKRIVASNLLCSTTSSGTVTAVLMTTSGGNGTIRCSNNRFNVVNNSLNYWSNIGVSDTLVSNFDDIVADSGHAGLGTIQYVSSPADGELHMNHVHFTEATNVIDATGHNNGVITDTMNVNVDTTSSTGGQHRVLQINSVASSPGTADIIALGACNNVWPICQQKTAATTLGKAWSVDSSVWTDRTVAFNSGTNVQIFPSDNDMIYIGSASTYNAITVNLAINSSQSIYQTTPQISYWNGATWASLTPADGTSGFIQSGNIIIGTLGSWATTQVNGEVDGPWYYIRIQRTRNNVVTPPTENLIQVVSTGGGMYYWNKDAILAVDRIGVDSYTVLGAPAATTAGQIIFVSNETGGAVLAFSDGTNWRRVTDRTVIS